METLRDPFCIRLGFRLHIPQSKGVSKRPSPNYFGRLLVGLRYFGNVFAGVGLYVCHKTIEILDLGRLF